MIKSPRLLRVVLERVVAERAEVVIDPQQLPQTMLNTTESRILAWLADHAAELETADWRTRDKDEIMPVEWGACVLSRKSHC